MPSRGPTRHRVGPIWREKLAKNASTLSHAISSASQTLRKPLLPPPPTPSPPPLPSSAPPLPSPFAVGLSTVCPGHFFKWDVEDFARNCPMHLNRTSGTGVLKYRFETMDPPCLRAVSCTGSTETPGSPCEHCTALFLEVNLLRERASRDFRQVHRTEELSWAQMRSKVDALQLQINELKLEMLNRDHKLDSADKNIAHYKALFDYLQETPVRALHRLFRNAGTERWSPQKMLAHCQKPVAGKYNPGPFFEWEIDIGMLVYELGGLSAVYALSKSTYALPSRNTLQKRRRRKHVQPSLLGVHLTEVYNNIATFFGGRTAPSSSPLPATPPPPTPSPPSIDGGATPPIAPAPQKYLHSALFDETAKTASVDYFTESDAMAGLCLEHLANLPTVQVGDDFESIRAAVQLVRDEKVHVADNLSVAAISRLSREGYGAKPVYVAASCKNGTYEDTLRVVMMVLEAWKRSPDGEVRHGPISSVASDGDAKRRVIREFAGARSALTNDYFCK
uniref:Uncharacterized protein n=1 Tax=Mycena chlorophos TaxID=658473 RepID=A0ABQ0KV39_MYCCL|nr:predicted protein [Mycena chlorophos]